MNLYDCPHCKIITDHSDEWNTYVNHDSDRGDIFCPECNLRGIDGFKSVEDFDAGERVFCRGYRCSDEIRKMLTEDYEFDDQLLAPAHVVCHSLEEMNARTKARVA